MSKFRKFIETLFDLEPAQNLSEDDKNKGGEEGKKVDGDKKPDVENPEQNLEVIKDAVDFYLEKTVLEQMIKEAVDKSTKANAEDVLKNPNDYVAFPPRWGQKAMNMVFDAIQGLTYQYMSEEGKEGKGPEDGSQEGKEPKEDTQQTLQGEFFTKDEVKELVSEVVSETLKRFEPIETELQELKLEMQKPASKPTKVNPSTDGKTDEPFSMTKLVEEGLKK
jgi:hypothetical protein